MASSSGGESGVGAPPGGRPTYKLQQGAAPEALVVYCSDPRFQSAFQQFIKNELGLSPGEYIPIVIGGGGGVLAHPEQLPKEFKFLKDRFEMHMHRFPSISRIVLINHEGCDYYEGLKDRLKHLFGPLASSTTDKQRNDLKGVARKLIGMVLPGVNIELYYAHLDKPDGDSVVFDRIPL